MKIKFKEYNPSNFDEFQKMVNDLYSEDIGGQLMSKKKIKATINEFFLHPEKLKIYIFSMKQDVLGYAIIVPFWSNEYGGNLFSIDEILKKSIQFLESSNLLL